MTEDFQDSDGEIEVNPNESKIEDCVTGIVAAYVSNNHLAPADLPALIESVHASLAGLGVQQAQAEPDLTLTPSQIRKSITPDALVSFIDGKPYKVLKRHLSRHGLDADAYRRKFGLPADYPMVAPAFSQQRSALAQSSGLGRKTRGFAKGDA